MHYSSIFFDIIIYLSLVSLFAVFVFQIWAFMKDLKNKDI